MLHAVDRHLAGRARARARQRVEHDGRGPVADGMDGERDARPPRGREEPVELVRRHAQDPRAGATAELAPTGQRSPSPAIRPRTPWPSRGESCAGPGTRHRCAGRGRLRRRAASTGMPRFRRRRPSISSAELEQGGGRVAEVRIGPDAVIGGVVARLARARDAEGGELAERRVQWRREGPRPGARGRGRATRSRAVSRSTPLGRPDCVTLDPAARRIRGRVGDPGQAPEPRARPRPSARRGSRRTRAGRRGRRPSAAVSSVARCASVQPRPAQPLPRRQGCRPVAGGGARRRRRRPPRRAATSLRLRARPTRWTWKSCSPGSPRWGAHPRRARRAARPRRPPPSCRRTRPDRPRCRSPPPSRADRAAPRRRPCRG